MPKPNAYLRHLMQALPREITDGVHTRIDREAAHVLRATVLGVSHPAVLGVLHSLHVWYRCGGGRQYVLRRLSMYSNVVATLVL